MNSIEFIDKLLEDAVEDEYIQLCKQAKRDLEELEYVNEEFEELDSKHYALEDQYETLEAKVEKLIDEYQQFKVYGLKSKEEFFEIMDNFEV